MNKYTSIVILVLLWLSSFSINSAEKNIPINTGHESITNTLIQHLESHNTWYQQKNETTVIVNLPTSQSILNLLEAESEKIIPKGRSMSVAIEHRNELYSQLKKKNISFKKVTYDNSEFIVWESSNTKEVNNLLEAIVINKLEATNEH